MTAMLLLVVALTAAGCASHDGPTERGTRAAVAAAPAQPAHSALPATNPTTNPAVRVLRIAADPNNLPFSNDRLEEFENRIAELLARKMGVKVEYA